MFKKSIFLASLYFAATAQAVPMLYTDDKAGFDAATTGLTFEGFETASLNSSTEVGFTGGTFSCSGSSYCPGFFGISSSYSLSGSQSVFFASPDTATFTFDSAINSFGVFMGGQGDVAPIDLFITTSNGDILQILNNYTGPFDVFGTNQTFVGLVDTSVLFTSITFSASNSGDGIFFDNLEFGVTEGSSVPEPSSLALMALGLLGIPLLRKKKSA